MVVDFDITVKEMEGVAVVYPAGYIDFDTSLTFLTGKRGRFFYYKPFGNFVYYVNDSTF